MTATINAKKGRPHYSVIIRYRDESGKECTKTVSTGIPVKGNNKRKAEKMKDEILAHYMQNKVDVGKDADFTEFAASWLETLRGAKKIAPTTYDAYLMTLNVHIIPYFGPLKLRIKDVEPRHVQQYVTQKLKTLSPNTVKKHVANISSCLESAVRQNIIAFNPAKRIEELRKEKYTGAQFMNEKQIEQLLHCSKGDPLEIVILLTVFYGLRRSEVLGLKWSAIDFDNNTISIRHTVVKVANTIHLLDSTKNDSSNDVLPLPTLVKACLLKWKKEQVRRKQLQPNDYDDSEYVCTMFDGSLIKPDYVSRHFKLILAKGSLPVVRFHDIRHSSASYLKHLGFDLKDIQTWLRHADIQTSMNLYTHLDMTAKMGIADKLDARIARFGLS